MGKGVKRVGGWKGIAGFGRVICGLEDMNWRVKEISWVGEELQQ